MFYHCKGNCPQYLEELNGGGASTSSIFVIEVNLCISTSWVLDTGCGSHICSNVQGLINRKTLAKGGYSYFVTFMDDFSRYGYVYLMKHKSEKFKEFKNEVQNQLGKSIKAIRSDRGGEYLRLEFDDYLK